MFQHQFNEGLVSSSGSDEVDVQQYNGPFSFFLNVTDANGTSPTLDVVIQEWDPFANGWFTIATFTQATGVTSEREELADIASGRIRALWTLGGTGPDFTFTLGAVGKNRGT